MAFLNVWDYLGILAILLLLWSFSIGKNAIWGMFTLGLLICLVVGIYTKIADGNTNWPLLRIIATIAVLIGALSEIPHRISKKRKA